MRSVALFLAMLIITPLLIFGCSCAKSATNNIVYHDSAHTSVRRDSVNQRQIHWQDTKQHDSVIKQDSVLVYIKGDTVKVKYYVNRYKTKEVEKPASTWHKIRLFAGDCVLLFLAIFAVCWIKERIKKRVQWVQS